MTGKSKFLGGKKIDPLPISPSTTLVELVENNFISYISIANNKGVILEDNVNNWIIRNNVFYQLGGEGIKLEGTGVSSNGHQIYNNLFLENGLKGNLGGGGGPGVYITTTAGKTASNNSVRK